MMMMTMLSAFLYCIACKLGICHVAILSVLIQCIVSCRACFCWKTVCRCILYLYERNFGKIPATIHHFRFLFNWPFWSYCRCRRENIWYCQNRIFYRPEVSAVRQPTALNIEWTFSYIINGMRLLNSSDMGVDRYCPAGAVTDRMLLRLPL